MVHCGLSKQTVVPIAPSGARFLN